MQWINEPPAYAMKLQRSDPVGGTGASDSNTTNLMERKVLNVVEEMAIASGMPAPPVYFSTESRASTPLPPAYSPSDAVIGVTRGRAESSDAR